VDEKTVVEAESENHCVSGGEELNFSLFSLQSSSHGCFNFFFGKLYGVTWNMSVTDTELFSFSQVKGYCMHLTSCSGIS